MIDPKVIEYIKAETAKGTSRDEIIQNLIKGGGWGFADIQAHFSHIEQNKSSASLSPVPNPQVIQNKPGKGINIVGANLLGFAGYYVLGLLLSKILGGELGMLFIFYGYMIHAAVLVIASVGEFIRGLVQKTHTNWAEYFLSAILLLIIGFGACTVAFTSGLVDLGL